MSQISKLFFAGLAAAATLGAAQLAAGETASGGNGEAVLTANLADRFQAVEEAAGARAINRSSKGDREIQAATSATTRTVLLKVESLADTSVLVRIPVQKDARNAPPAQSIGKPAKKMTVACEPPVSVLTDVAKLLQPGRCVT